MNLTHLSNGNFVLTLPNDPEVVSRIMLDHGMDLSSTRTTASSAVLFTRSPYSAVGFWDHGDERARAALSGLHQRIESSWASSSDRHISLPPERELWGFQRAAVDYALTGFTNTWDDIPSTLLGDEPGLGKTEEAIAIANEIQAAKVLIVCPGAVRDQWATRILEWSTMPSLWQAYRNGVRVPTLNQICLVSSARVGLDPRAPWTIISYDLIRNPVLFGRLMENEYDLLILDEAHYVKAPGAKRTKALFGNGGASDSNSLRQRCRAVLALTGTYLPNRPAEAFVLASGMCSGAIDDMGHAEFLERYNPSVKVVHRGIGGIGGWSKSYHVEEQVGRTAELQARLRGNFMTRHLKREVMTQLKMPVYDIVRLLVTSAVKAALAAEKLLDIDPYMDLTRVMADPGMIGPISSVRKEMGVALAPQCADYIRLLLEGGEEKLVVFAWHKEVMDILCKELDNWGVLRVDGRTSPQQKREMVLAFQTDPRRHVILGNTLTLGTGTDGLQLVCSHAVITEPDWVPGNNVQCFDRLDRGGQTRTVYGEILVAPNSLSEGVLSTALKKMTPVHNVLDRR